MRASAWMEQTSSGIDSIVIINWGLKQRSWINWHHMMVFCQWTPSYLDWIYLSNINEVKQFLYQSWRHDIIWVSKSVNHVNHSPIFGYGSAVKAMTWITVWLSSCLVYHHWLGPSYCQWVMRLKCTPVRQTKELSSRCADFSSMLWNYKVNVHIKLHWWWIILPLYL